MHFSWNISWLCFYFFSGTLFLVQDSISWKKFVNTKFYNSLNKRNFRIRWCWIRWKALFIYIVLNTSAPQERMAEKKLVKWRTRKKKSAASEVHYGRNFLILTRNYEVFFQQRRIGQSDHHVAYHLTVILWIVSINLFWPKKQYVV